MTTVRLGVVGAGAMGSRIAAAAAGSGRFEVVAVADIDPARRLHLARTLGAAPFDDVATLLGAGSVDALALVLPPTLNVGACRQAAAAGVHVMVDKPLATSTADGAEIAALADASSTAWMVGFSYRFRAEWQRAREVIATGRLGAPFLVTDIIIESASTTPAWYWDSTTEGGVINLQSHHCFDRLRWLLGSEVAGVACCVSRTAAGTDRSAQILASFADSATASIALGFGLRYTDEPRTLLVVQCDDGMVQIDSDRNLRITDPAGATVESFRDDDWITRELTTFADAIAGRVVDHPTVADGVEALRCALAAAESAPTGYWVTVDRSSTTEEPDHHD
jgi:predicted dehydrogenase